MKEEYQFEKAPPPVPEEQITQTFEADAVVVGEGFSGLCCAMSAQESGADTIVVTASSRPVGRGGSVFAAYSKVMEEKGIPRQDLDTFLLGEFAANSFEIDQRKWYTVIDRSEEAMNWMIDIVRGAGMEVVLEDANEDDHDSPTYQPPGTHAFVDGKITRAGVGITLALRALEEKFLASGGRVLRRSPARYLEKENGRVSAVIAQTAEGTYVRVKARRGIVLATGDFSANPEMMEKYCPQYAPYFTSSGEDYDVGFAMNGLYRGEGHQMALWAGAAWQKTWPCAVNIQGSRLGSNLPYGSHRGLRINKFGERYCNEDMNGAYTALTTLREPGGTAYAIWGSNYAEDINWRPHGGQRDGADSPAETVRQNWQTQAENHTIVRGDTPAEVAEQLGLPVEKTLETIAHYNELCKAGRDTDFHKKPKYLQEIRTPPFYGADLGDRRFFCVMGGPRTNHKMQICDENDMPIPGLFCVGCMVGDMYAHCYTFRIPGQNYGTCLTYGYLTGKLLAGLES